ncbi:hypothetical protein NL517_29100, partial [Klebsiella pneumoniae]|nr:hypothetical protein [Klebsiella pneumoniae]
PFFFLGFLAGGYLDFSLLAFGGVGVIIALIYIQLTPQWRKAESAASNAPSAPALDQLDDLWRRKWNRKKSRKATW